MKSAAIISTAILSLTLAVTAPVYGQEQHEQRDEQNAKPAHEDQRTQSEKSARQEEKPAARPENGSKPQERNTKQENNNSRPAQKNVEAQHDASNRGGRIPDDRFKAHFGREHSFRVTQSDYRNHRFQYGGYSFGFVDPWPSNWLYTQDVYVVDINGVYYLCNPEYPGVNIALSFTL